MSFWKSALGALALISASFPALAQDGPGALSRPVASLVPRGNETPSFDCAKAKTAAARLICADGELARLDGQLGAAFQKRKAQIPASDRSNFVADQFAWIRVRNTHCDLDGKGNAAIEVLVGAKPCMLTAIRERFAFLAQTDSTAAPPQEPTAILPPVGLPTHARAAPDSNPFDQFDPDKVGELPATQKTKADDPFEEFNPFPGQGIKAAVPKTSATGATIGLASRADGTPVVGVKVEGDITPGDALKLLAIYEQYGPNAVSPVYLRSKGGDVEEAVRMGRLIRALRLETRAPDHFDSQLDEATFERSVVPATNKDNFVCASACFLVFVGGVDRSGDFLVLHRPYLSRQAARNLSDLSRESEQKQVMAEVRDYLLEMEVDQFFIDKMMWTSSQDAYVTTLADVLNHHLNGIVPSIEEIILPSCDALTQHERDLFDKSTNAKLREQLGAKLLAASTCKGMQLDLLRDKAWDRQHEDALQAKCGQLTLQEQRSLIAFFKKPPDQRSAGDKQEIMPLLDKQDALTACKSELLYDITISAAKRYHQTAEQHAAATLPPTPEKPFDATGLSADEMLKKGDGAFKAKDYAGAMRWYNKAADIGNARAMLEISRLYASGNGVARDDAEAMRWRSKAVERGDASVIDSIGADYEYGWDGMAQDYVEAMRWYRKAADLGSADAMLSIGHLYDSGWGVAQDKAEAMRWLRKAADLGKTLAMYTIGVHYEYGDGVPQNDAEARLWIKKAAGLGDLAANMWLADNP
jgi:uncharacterized protein